jgi:hypothetical protein
MLALLRSEKTEAANQIGKVMPIVQLRARVHCTTAIAQNRHTDLIGDPSQATVGCCHL